MNTREAAAALNALGAARGVRCSHEQVRRICLPFGDKLRRVPSVELADVIAILTQGEVTRADFFEPPAAGGRP